MSESKTKQLDSIDKIFDYVDDVIMAGQAGKATVAKQVSEIIGTWRANE